MSENPQGQPGAQYASVPDKIAALEKRVADLESQLEAVVVAADGQFLNVGRALLLIADMFEDHK